nr:hypothetical protein GCM10025699_56080 [Microbacterium flavescens]
MAVDQPGAARGEEAGGRAVHGDGGSGEGDGSGGLGDGVEQGQEDERVRGAADEGGGEGERYAG